VKISQQPIAAAAAVLGCLVVLGVHACRQAPQDSSREGLHLGCTFTSSRWSEAACSACPWCCVGLGYALWRNYTGRACLPQRARRRRRHPRPRRSSRGACWPSAPRSGASLSWRSVVWSRRGWDLRAASPLRARSRRDALPIPLTRSDLRLAPRPSHRQSHRGTLPAGDRARPPRSFPPYPPFPPPRADRARGR
jgi:hypothetical protein